MNIRPDIIHIVVGADEPIVRYGIRRLLEADLDLRIAGEASNGREAVRLTSQLKPDVLVMDFVLRQSVLEVLSELGSLQAGARTIVLMAQVDRSQVFEAFRWGARGVLFKDAATELLPSSVRTVMAGEYWLERKSVPSIADALRQFERHGTGRQVPRTYGLTPREFDIIGTILTGCSNKDVGRKFSISERTVKHHLSNIYDKLGVSNRLELAIFAMNHGLENSESRQPHDSPRAAPEPEYQEV